MVDFMSALQGLFHLLTTKDILHKFKHEIEEVWFGKNVIMRAVWEIPPDLPRRFAD